MKFTVTDFDTSDNGSPFTFDIVAGNSDGEFHVDNDGVLSTAGKLSKQVRGGGSIAAVQMELISDEQDLLSKYTCGGVTNANINRYILYTCMHIICTHMH